MKHILLILCLLSGSLFAQTNFFTEDFETDGQGTRYTSANEFVDEGSGGNAGTTRDYIGRIDASGASSIYSGCASFPLLLDAPTDYSGATGSFVYGAEDINHSGGCGNNSAANTANLIIDNININGSSMITCKVLVATGAGTVCGATDSRWDNDETFKVFYEVDNTGEQNGLCFASHLTCAGGAPDNSNNPLGLDLNCDGDGGDGLLSSTLTEYSFLIPAGGTSLTLRFEFGNDDGGQSIAFDNVRLEAVTPPLPVALVDFRAEKVNDKAVLAWATAMESDNDYFSIEHSRDGVNFRSIGQVDGKGDSDDLAAYQFQHDRPVAGANFYRLKQVDFDGAFEYSAIRQVTFDRGSKGPKFTVSPNPTNGYFQVDITEELAAGASIEVLDLQGRKLQSNVYDEKIVRPTLNISTLPAGTYLLRLTSNGTSSLRRIVKQ
ncbi:MAG: T9SS type A sorting domain-containing protein [Bacteroidota bacterium]